jgi:hypothetical protein
MMFRRLSASPRRPLIRRLLLVVSGLTIVGGVPAQGAPASATPASTPITRSSPANLDVVVAAKRTAIADDRFIDFRSAFVEGRGYRTTTSFLVERREMNLGGAVVRKLVVRLGFSIPAKNDDYPLYLFNCAPPKPNSSINGIVWVLSDSGSAIEAVSPIWGSSSCFGRLG